MPLVRITDRDILRIDTEQFPEVTAVEWVEVRHDQRLYLHGDLRQVYNHIASNPDAKELGTGGVPVTIRLQTYDGMDETFRCFITKMSGSDIEEFSFQRVPSDS